MREKGGVGNQLPANIPILKQNGCDDNDNRERHSWCLPAMMMEAPSAICSCCALLLAAILSDHCSPVARSNHHWSAAKQFQTARWRIWSLMAFRTGDVTERGNRLRRSWIWWFPATAWHYDCSAAKYDGNHHQPGASANELYIECKSGLPIAAHQHLKIWILTLLRRISPAARMQNPRQEALRSEKNVRLISQWFLKEIERY